MPFFQIGDTVETEEPVLTVENNGERFLAPGTHVFQLIVIDDAGNESKPATLQITVRDSTLPTAVIEGPSQVEPAASFKLSGGKSSDVPPGTVVRYVWTLLS